MTAEMLLEHLRQHSTAYQTVAVMGALLVNVAYIVLTYRMLQEARRTRLQQMSPNVICDVELKGWFWAFVVRNTGHALATDVRITVDPPIQVGRTVLAEMTIPTLAPGRELGKTLGVLQPREPDDQQVPGVHEVTVTFRDSGGRQQSQRYEIDLSLYAETTLLVQTELGRIGHMLERIEREVRNVGQALKALKR